MFDQSEVILIVLITCIIVSYITYHATEFIIVMRMLSKLSNEELLLLETKLNKIEEKIKSTKNKNTQIYYIVDYDNGVIIYDSFDNFVCQSRTLSDAIDTLSLKNKSYTIIDEDNKQYSVKDGKIEINQTTP